MFIQTGDNAGIGGFIISGSAPKHVLVRVIGPSLTQFGVPNALADPVLELHGLSAPICYDRQRYTGKDDPVQGTHFSASGPSPRPTLSNQPLMRP